MKEQSNAGFKALVIPLVIIVVLLGALFFGSLFHEKNLVPSMRKDKPLPEYSAKVLFEDRVLNTKELRGEYYLLNFWGSWCPTCYVEHPYLMKLKSQGIKIIGVNYKDTESDALRFLNTNGNPYAFSFYDPKGRFAIEMGITAAPETFLISPDGYVLFHRVGEMHEKLFTEQLLPLMKK